MVDLFKLCEEYDLEYFSDIEKELSLFPHFIVLQKRYVEVGEFLKVKTEPFLVFAQKWNKAQELIDINKDLWQEVKPKCTYLEKKELLEAFLIMSKVPHSPREVFANF